MPLVVSVDVPVGVKVEVRDADDEGLGVVDKLSVVDGVCVVVPLTLGVPVSVAVTLGVLVGEIVEDAVTVGESVDVSAVFGGGRGETRVKT